MYCNPDSNWHWHHAGRAFIQLLSPNDFLIFHAPFLEVICEALAEGSAESRGTDRTHQKAEENNHRFNEQVQVTHSRVRLKLMEVAGFELATPACKARG